MNIVRSILAVFIFGTAFGCSTRIAGLTVASTKNVYPKGIDVSALPRQEGVEATDIGFLGIGTSLADAVDKALERGQGNLMIDAVVYIWQAPLFIGWKVRGTVVNVPYYEDGDRLNHTQIRREVIAKSAPETPGGTSRSHSAWSRLRRGLDPRTVRDLLGAPAEKSVSPKSTIWFYPDIEGGYVLFAGDRVKSWKAP